MRVLALAVMSSLVAAAWPGQAQASHTFDEASGFPKARGGRESIRVCAPEGIDGAGVVAPWNRLAGWRLFILTCSEPDVTFVPSKDTWVEADYRAQFTYCRIHYASNSTNVHRHEIGHCLGFADHVWPWEQDDPKWINPQSCVGYRGVMSYCDWDGREWFGKDDRAMLKKAGYVRERPSSSPWRLVLSFISRLA